MSGVEKLVLSGPDGGRRETFLLREYKSGDEAGMAACVRDEYGGTYFKQWLYQEENIRHESESGRIKFLVAEDAQGQVAGMLMLRQFYPKEGMCEIASMIFRRKYRGYGLAMPFFIYGKEILDRGDYTAAYCLPVLWHDITQKLLYRLGLRATGFVFNVFDMEKVDCSYSSGRNRKHSQGIQIQALGKKDAGILYIPPEHADFAKGIYESLGVRYRLSDEGNSRAGEDTPLTGILAFENDSVQESLEISIHSVGMNTVEGVKTLLALYPLTGMQTANVFLNCNDRYAPWVYGELCRIGFFFAGLKPLCSEREYMVMHHPGQVRIYLEDYELDGGFAALGRYIKDVSLRARCGQGEVEG